MTPNPAERLIQTPCPWCKAINCADTMHLILADQLARPGLVPSRPNTGADQ